MARETIDLPDGGRYEGAFRAGLPNGHGVRVEPDGERYEGDWQDGKEHGHGMITWPDGCHYTGDLVLGEWGRGVYTWPDGSQFEGTFRDGQPGNGVLTRADGAMQRGEFGSVEGGGFGVLRGRYQPAAERCHLSRRAVRGKAARARRPDVPARCWAVLA